MSLLARITLGVLVFDAVALAAVELLYLPLRVGTVPFPITVPLAAVSTPWLVRSAAELGGPSVVAAAPLVVWALVLVVLGIGGPGGDVLLAPDWRSALLLCGGMFPAAVMLGRALARSGAAGPCGDTE
ncbi:MAG: hypothetical protein JO364_10585 [Pseudonocardiales bacterium]|nr:hypothetical protein [Pseudonocardiales bacterium]MBV9030729.1 hypothetical protein [Pseudonocardiales bacterium]